MLVWRVGLHSNQKGLMFSHENPVMIRYEYIHDHRIFFLIYCASKLGCLFTNLSYVKNAR